MNYQSDPKRFAGSRRMVWFVLVAGNIQMAALLLTQPDQAGQVYLVGVPTMLALAGAWTGVTNWAEVKRG